MLELAGINYWAVLVTKYTNIDILKIPTEQANKIIMAVATEQHHDV